MSVPKVRLMKPVVVRYRLKGRAVPIGTPGAKKCKEQTDKWYAEWRECGKKKRLPLATDKGVAQKMLGDLVVRMEKGQANMLDPYEEHRRRPVAEHVADYLASLETKDVSAKHYAERSRCLSAVLAGCHVKTLADLTADKLDRYLAGMDTSARTKDTYRSAAIAFGNFLERRGRLDRNPLLHTTKPQGECQRVRRALTPEELQMVLDAARQRPLREFSTIRRGARKGQAVAKVRPEVRERLLLLGRERSLIYKTAVFTGLRKGEISALRVCHLHLDAKPFPLLLLPGEFTKNGDEATLLLLPSFAEELRQWISDTRKQPADPLFSLRLEMVKNLKNDLKAAGIPFRDSQGRTADFHSLRMTANMMLARAGVPLHIRMRFMRHGEARLTATVYDDTGLQDLERAVRAMEGYNLR